MIKRDEKVETSKPTSDLGAELAELKARIRAVGLKWTSARGAVLTALTHADRPLSHAELVDLVEDQGFDRATVYRNLMDLTGSGLVSRADLGDHIWRFELKEADDSVHPHFMCTSCGAVSCLPETVVPTRTMALRASVHRIDEVLLKGACASCI